MNQGKQLLASEAVRYPQDIVIEVYVLAESSHGLIERESSRYKSIRQLI